RRGSEASLHIRCDPGHQVHALVHGVKFESIIHRLTILPMRRIDPQTLQVMRFFLQPPRQIFQAGITETNATQDLTDLGTIQGHMTNLSRKSAINDGGIRREAIDSTNSGHIDSSLGSAINEPMPALVYGGYPQQ
ncbi:MAG: hypothetical protein NTZ79_17215, partial [Proteobacteria bacterium]|nr:hypothetical protein [Pseudomonadota bacterium]